MLSALALCHAFDDADEQRVIKAFEAVAEALPSCLEAGPLPQQMDYPIIQPSFSVPEGCVERPSRTHRKPFLC